MPPRHVCVLVLAALLPAVAVDSGDVDVEVPSSSELLPTECEDEDLDCREWAEKGYCLGIVTLDDGSKTIEKDIAARMMSRCRPSCRARFSSQERAGNLTQDHLRLLRNLGGAEDEMLDLFGRRTNVCDMRAHGWTAMSRQSYIEKRLLAATYHTSKVFGPRRYSENGFDRDRVPRGLWADLRSVYEEAKEAWARGEAEREDCSPRDMYRCAMPEDDGWECRLRPITTQLLHRLNSTMQTRIAEVLGPLAEEWAGGLKLRFNNAYGIRRYLKGAWVGGHTDTVENKIISAIINVGQDVGDHPWPLNILDYGGRHHRVTLRPGDLVWYESGKVPHGREEVFRGNFYDNVFVHFYPDWYIGATSEEVMFPSTHDKGRTRFDEQ